MSGPVLAAILGFVLIGPVPRRDPWRALGGGFRDRGGLDLVDHAGTGGDFGLATFGCVAARPGREREFRRLPSGLHHRGVVDRHGLALGHPAGRALGRRSNLFIIHTLSRSASIEFVRGVPLITMLFTASLLLQYFLPPQVQFETIYLRVIILVTFFSAAYIAG